jgi:hypothetical protein
VSQSKQRSHTPRCGRAEHGDESHSDRTIYRCAFAPALEHGNSSNEKQYDRDDANNFQQHDPTLLIPT